MLLRQVDEGLARILDDPNDQWKVPGANTVGGRSAGAEAGTRRRTGRQRRRNGGADTRGQEADRSVGAEADTRRQGRGRAALRTGRWDRQYYTS